MIMLQITCLCHHDDIRFDGLGNLLEPFTVLSCRCDLDRLP